MGYSKEIRDLAKRKIDNRRLVAENEADVRKERIFSLIPEAKNYEKLISNCGIKAVKAVLLGSSAKEEMEKLKEQSLQLQREYEELLAKHGYTKEDLHPFYMCKKCNDTGYIEINNRTIMCDCLKNMQVECACAELNKYSPLSLCTFEDFSLEYYSQDIEDGYPRSSYEQMHKNLNYCISYANNFTKKSNNIFMKGETGLGKTHLSLAIANEVIKKGYGVIYVSAPTITSKLNKEHFSYDSDNKTEEALLSCDLLIIDDLGTEFVTQYSATAIYNIFNSRLLANKPVIINTNLPLKELEKLYSQRFVSRITGHADRLDFFGKDIRIIKRTM